ncbi:hypothetical protein GCM10027562_15990 [Arthrobacter pigmenti]
MLFVDALQFCKTSADRAWWSGQDGGAGRKVIRPALDDDSDAFVPWITWLSQQPGVMEPVIGHVKV